MSRSNKKLKKAVRARMAKTGEAYTVARAAVLAELASKPESDDGGAS